MHRMSGEYMLAKLQITDLGGYFMTESKVSHVEVLNQTRLVC